MMLHRGDAVLFKGEQHIVKDVISPTWPIIEDEYGLAFAVRPEQLSPVVTVGYRPHTMCDLCGRFEDDMTIVLDGEVKGICSICYEKSDRHVPFEDESDDD